MSIDELPEEQLDHILRYFLCDSERQGDGDTPQSVGHDCICPACDVR